ncbi:MAG: insulinase family protein [Deltaproteobacteria bacterium]|nr:insulinase family protein [Deltaproteobacteria bacterium]
MAALEKTPLPQIHVPDIARVTLGNGLQLMMLEDTELPVVRGYLYLRIGGIYDPAEKLGLATMLGELLREGGTAKHPSEKFEAELAAVGADIESDFGREYGLIGFKCLKEDLPTVLGLVFEMLREPAFEAKKLELVRVQMLEQLRRQNEDPAKIASREFPKLIYGKDSVWARSATPATVKSLTREDVVAFYKKFTFPDRIILSVSGDFDPKAVVKRVEGLTQGWSKATEALPVIPPVVKQWSSGEVLIPKQADQATLMLGHFGDKRFNPDKYALLLLNDILGGEALVSRLGKRVRSTLGLAYGIYSRFGLETDYGVFTIMAQTQAKNSRRVLEESRKILEEIRRPDSITEAELEFYKQSLLNSLYSEYEPRYNFAKDEARFTYFGYPPRYIELFRENIEKVTLADIRRVAEKYLNPEALQVLVVGNPKEIGPLPGAKVVPLNP